MFIVRKLALTVLIVFGVTLVAPTSALASGPDHPGRQGDVKVCKVLKDVRHVKESVSFDFVIREKKGALRYRFDIAFYKHDRAEKKCDQFSVNKGSYVVRELNIPRGYRLHDIDVWGCSYKDRNDRDAKVVVDVMRKSRCTVTFTNEKARW